MGIPKSIGAESKDLQSYPATSYPASLRLSFSFSPLKLGSSPLMLQIIGDTFLAPSKGSGKGGPILEVNN